MRGSVSGEKKIALVSYYCFSVQKQNLGNNYISFILHNDEKRMNV